MREGREGKVEKQVRKASPRRPCIDPSITSVPRDLIRLLHATQGVQDVNTFTTDDAHPPNLEMKKMERLFQVPNKGLKKRTHF